METGQLHTGHYFRLDNEKKTRAIHTLTASQDRIQIGRIVDYKV